MFSIASQHNLRVVTVNVPYTPTSQPIKGVSIGGPFAPAFSRDIVSPATYFDEIRRIVPDYFVLPDYDSQSADPLADFASRLLEGIGLREHLCLHLLKNEDWDLFTAVFMATDQAQHTYWHCQDAEQGSALARYRHVIRDVYQRIDQAIGAILGQVLADSERETTIVILSDHGAGPFSQMINLNRWLAEMGYLHFRTGYDSALRGLWADGIKHLASLYRRHLPATVRAIVRDRLGSRGFDRVKSNVESALLTSNVAWKKTRAYALGAGGNIFLNVKDREPSGIVESGTEYEQLRQDLIDDLMDLSDPESGQPIVEQVYRREDLYQGPFLNQAPDLVIKWRDYAYWGRGRYDSQSPIFETGGQFDFTDQPLTGSHRLEGMLIAQGASIRSGAKLEGTCLLDLAPTILNLLGIDLSDSLDGRILRDISSESQERLQAGSTEAEGRTAVSVEEVEYSSEEAERISERLRSLGYL
jgi:predicted AlkP superfamily phosphohydrolase/phosphomutase